MQAGVIHVLHPSYKWTARDSYAIDLELIFQNLRSNNEAVLVKPRVVSTRFEGQKRWL